MWPLGGLIGGLSNALAVPGQDSQETFWGGFAGEGQWSRSGVYFSSTTTNNVSPLYKDGALAIRHEPYGGPVTRYTERSNEFIHDDFKPFSDSSLYECRYVNVTGDTAFLTGSTWFGPTYGDEDGWQSCETQPYWMMQVYIPVGPGGFVQWECEGLLQVREKANHANIVTGDVRLVVDGEGAT